MKKRFAAALLFAVLLLLTGCVSQADYDELAREREELAGQAEALSQEIEGLKSDVAALQEYVGELHEENDELREALSAAEKEAAEQQKKIENFIKTIEEMEERERFAPPSPGSGFFPAQGENVQSAWEAFTELLELVGKPLSLR